MIIDVDDGYLKHFGTKGMRWGVRKDRPTLEPRAEGVKVGADGSIEVSPGASLQRLVRSNGKSMPMKGMTYASLTEYDNLRYIKAIGGKGIFGGGRDQVLDIRATKPIKAPSVAKSTELTTDLFLNDKRFRESVNVLGKTVSDKELSQMRAEPSGKVAKKWYEEANVALTFDKEFDPGAPYVQNKMRDQFVKNGFNAVRDENDVRSGIARAPIIIFSPETSLRVVKVTDLTDPLRATSKERLREYRRQGQRWLDENLYE